MENVLIYGAGTMGKGIAQLFAARDFNVTICDVAEKLPGLRGSFSAERVALFPPELLTAPVLGGIDLAIEAVNEERPVKAGVLARLDALLPAKAVVATNTSTLSINELSRGLARADRFLGLHFFNPPAKMKLVEVVKGAATSAETLSTVLDLCRRLDKRPVVLDDTPGFIVNRLLFAMLNEAFALYQTGIADGREIDEAMKLGLGHPLGPLALADLIGLDVCRAILLSLREALHDEKFTPAPVLLEKIGRGELGRKTGKGFYEYA